MSPRSKQIEQPFSEWPPMKGLEREPGFQITGSYLAPSWWWSHGFFVVLLLASIYLLPASCTAMNGGSLRAVTAEEALWHTGGYVLLVFVLAAVAERIGTRRKLDVKITREAIEIDGKRYARAVRHQYAIEEHEKAVAETEAARRGYGRPIYREAMQVVMRYGERRVPIADLRRADLEKAQALLVRLQDLDRGLEKILGMAEAPRSEERDAFGKVKPIR